MNLTLTNTGLDNKRVPQFDNTAICVPVRIVAVFEVEAVGALVHGVLHAVPHPASFGDSRWLTWTR
jgi:hypothetical protein